MHHRRDAHRAHRRERFAADFADVCRKLRERVLHTGPDVVEPVRPVTALEAVFPVVRAARERRSVRRGQHRLDARGAELDAERRGLEIQFFHIVHRLIVV